MTLSRALVSSLMIGLTAANAGCTGAAPRAATGADALLSPDFVNQGPGGVKLDLDGYLSFMVTMNHAFTDMHMEFTHVVAEGDLVSVHFTVTFVHTGVYQGIPATQKRITVAGATLRQMRDGKVVAERDNTDMLGLMSQLGVAHVGRKTERSKR